MSLKAHFLVMGGYCSSCTCNYGYLEGGNYSCISDATSTSECTNGGVLNEWIFIFRPPLSIYIFVSFSKK